MKSIYTTKDIDFMKEHYKDMSYKDIGLTLGFTERQIRGKINNMGLTKNREYNKDFFKNIDSANKAYWLGFIYADGNISNNSLNIEIDYSDRYLLKRFANDIDSQVEVTQRERDTTFNGYTYHTHTSLVRLYCKDIANQLIKLGVVPTKTYKKEYPKCDKFFWHFLRGFLDGDGCLYLDKNNKLVMHFTNPNELFLNYLQKKIYDALSITGKIYKEKEWKYRLYYSNQEEVKTILSMIYDLTDCDIKLERKYEIYKTFLGLAA